MSCLPRMLPSPSPNVTNLNSNSNPYSALFYAIVLNPVRSPLRCHTTQSTVSLTKAAALNPIPA
jgi:hypothetical protein